jgi:hypothetical protein
LLCQDSTLASIQFTCVYLACKVVDRMPMMDTLRYMLTHLYGSLVSSSQAYEVESKCLEVSSVCSVHKCVCEGSQKATDSSLCHQYGYVQIHSHRSASYLPAPHSHVTDVHVCTSYPQGLGFRLGPYFRHDQLDDGAWSF